MSKSTTIFAVNGAISKLLPNYENRKEQIEMTKEVEKVILEGGVLLAEAGTGTGKTLAYLVPSVLSEQTVIISTGTKNLQEQIFFKDIVFLEKVLKTKINVAYLKGQNNYLCQNRLSKFIHSPRCLLYPSHDVADLNSWAQTTHTGDRMELFELSDDSLIWKEVCSTRESRIGKQCPFYESCFVTKARKDATFAKIVIVNHHLYFADLATRKKGGSILPKHDVVIFDEAHLIEDIATEFFSIKVSSAKVERTILDAMTSVKMEKFIDDQYEQRRQTLLENIRSASSQMFEMFRGSAGRTHLKSETLQETSISAYHKLDSVLEAFELSLRALEGRCDSIDHCTTRLLSLRQDLSDIIENNNSKFVYWVETHTRSVSLGASPIDISNEFKEDVLFSHETVVLTSATLSTNGNFSFLRSRLGIDFDSTNISLAAPFNYQKQACLFIPTDLPDPRDDMFAERAAEISADLIELTNGGALILCTSKKNMQIIYDFLQTKMTRPLLLQGTSPKSKLLSDFIKDETSILVATASFWQGVDLPGDALRLVIIDKLPFASPSEPIISARIDRLKKLNQKPFTCYQVPHAALALKQGFGRLIRTKHDHGIVAILDRRLGTMGYAKTFLNSLPECTIFNNLPQIENWWKTSRQYVHLKTD